jgi:DNA polymerase theta
MYVECFPGATKQKRHAYTPPRGAYFILQLHDELIYEVNADDMPEVCKIVKQNMESAMKLAVKLPVKLKAGPSWGSMVDIDN